MSPVAGIPAQKLVEEHPPNLSYPIREWVLDAENKFTDLLKKIDQGETPGGRDRVPPERAEKLLGHDHLHPWSLYVFLQMEYGSEWIDWEPETIKKTIEREKNITINEMVENLVGVLKGVLKDHRFWRDYRVFGWSCTAWNNQIPRFDIIPKPYPSFILDTVSGVRLLRSDVFKPEVKIYIRETLAEFGVGTPLALNFVDRPASDLTKEFLYAKNKESVDTVLEEAEANNNHYDLKTIGAVDYYLSRLQSLHDQLTRLLGGLVVDGPN